MLGIPHLVVCVLQGSSNQNCLMVKEQILPPENQKIDILFRSNALARPISVTCANANVAILQPWRVTCE